MTKTDLWFANSAPELRGISGVVDGAGAQVWVVGSNGFFAHWDGSVWSAVESGTTDLNAVWAATKDEVRAVGDNGTIVHMGGSPPVEDSTATARLLAIDGDGTDFWAVGESGTVRRLVAGAWSWVDPKTKETLQGVGVRSGVQLEEKLATLNQAEITE